MRGRFTLLAVLVAACGGGSQGMAGMPGTPPSPAPAATSRAAAAPAPASAPDVHFMSGMIPHHGQAVLIAGWAETHGASPSVRVLCQRIVVGQRDEIALMSQWLKDHGQPVPDPNAPHMMDMPGMAGMSGMAGMQHGALMPGMLNEEELAKLDAARGPEFDRLFLTYMIGHHQGAVMMVDDLLASNNAAQDNVVYKMASDIYADQNIEIERMQKMLAVMP